MIGAFASRAASRDATTVELEKHLVWSHTDSELKGEQAHLEVTLMAGIANSCFCAYLTIGY